MFTDIEFKIEKDFFVNFMKVEYSFVFKGITYRWGIACEKEHLLRTQVLLAEQFARNLRDLMNKNV